MCPACYYIHMSAYNTCLAVEAGVPNPKPAFFFLHFFCIFFLHFFLCVAGLELSEEEAGALFLLVDEDKSGVLTFDEVACLLEHGAKDFEGHRYACRV